MRFLKIKYLWLVLAFSAVVLVAAPVETLRIATWNVENLFDAEVDHEVPDSVNFTPDSWRRWTEAKYLSKLTNLAVVVSAMKPDVLCLEELENRKVIEDFVRILQTLPTNAVHYPYIAHKPSEDRRGISTGMISRYPITDTRIEFPVKGMRGALIVTLDIDGTEVIGIVNHWKSWVGEAKENIAIRTKEAIGVRHEALKLLERNPNLSLFIAGDFNDDLDGESLQHGLQAFADREKVLAGLTSNEIFFYNVLGELPKEKLGSYYYARRKAWNTFDAIILAPAMLRPVSEEGPAWRLPPKGEAVVETFKIPGMAGADGRPLAAHRTRLKDGTDKYVDGYSDHFPVFVDLKRALGRDVGTPGRQDVD